MATPASSVSRVVGLNSICTGPSKRSISSSRFGILPGSVQTAAAISGCVFKWAKVMPSRLVVVSTPPIRSRIAMFSTSLRVRCSIDLSLNEAADQIGAWIGRTLVIDLLKVSADGFGASLDLCKAVDTIGGAVASSEKIVKIGRDHV